MLKTVKFVLAVTAVATLVACGKQEVAVEKPKEPQIPELTASELLDMTKNERQEIERRCIGQSHTTCSELKGDSFKKMKDFRISLCRVGAAQTGLSDRYEGAREERKCDDMF